MENKQLETVTEIFNHLIGLGYECNLYISGCRYDIKVEIGTIKTNNLTTGIIGVFWNSFNSNHKIGYLCAAAPYFDGYQVNRRWVNDINISDIVNIVEEDVKKLALFHNIQMRKFN